MLEALSIMKWPLAACLLLPGILVYLGLHIVRREIIFVDLALAQMAALGTCVAILLGCNLDSLGAYAWSLGLTLIGATVFTLTRNTQHRVPQEALIGIVYVVAAATGLLLLSRNPEGNEELRRTLVGDILLVRPAEVGRTFALYVAIGAVHFLFRKQFLRISFEPDRAISDGISVRLWDFLFYVLFGLVVTSFVHIGGVLLVFSYLIVPAVCASFLVDSLAARLAIGWVTATLGSLIGLYASFSLDLPTGAAIVCALGALLIVTAALAQCRHGKNRKAVQQRGG
jgi:zinc/manganese transport system permease protein